MENQEEPQGTDDAAYAEMMSWLQVFSHALLQSFLPLSFFKNIIYNGNENTSYNVTGSRHT